MLFRSQACRSLIVDSDSDNTTLKIYEYSEDITFGIPSGYTGRNLNCDPNNAYIKMDQYEMIGMPDILPCSGIKVICNVTNECFIEYGNSSMSPLRYYQPFFNCYGPLYLREIFPIKCLGTCPGTPTTAPTTIPSFSPTGNSMSPSNAPTVPPSSAPTYSPTESPTLSPTNSPLDVSEFDSFIDITYILGKITQSEKTRFGQHAVNETTNLVELKGQDSGYVPGL